MMGMIMKNWPDPHIPGLSGGVVFEAVVVRPANAGAIVAGSGGVRV